MVTPSFKPSIRRRMKEAWLSFCLPDTVEPAETNLDPNGRLCFTLTHPCAQVDCLCVCVCSFNRRGCYAPCADMRDVTLSRLRSI